MTRKPVLTLFVALALAGCKKQVSPQGGLDTRPPPLQEKPVQAPAHVADMASNFQKVFFDFDQSTLGPEARDALTANARIMKDHTDVKVEIQGHADERGTTDYNLALGQRRAEAVAKHMQAEGIAPSRVTTVSYGEERPAATGNTEVAWSKNRRAEFRITWSTDAQVSGTIK